VPPLVGATPQSPAASAVPVASDTLDGTWELVSVIEDGKVMSLEIVKQTMIRDARVIVNGQLAAVIRPDGKVRTFAFVTNPNATPRTVDIAGDLRVGGKGIYMRDGDVLMICTRGSDSAARPTVMASLPGTDMLLMTFRRMNAEPATPVRHTPPPVPVIPAVDDARKMLIGTWGHQNDDQIVKGTLNPDGSYSVLTTYKKGFKKMFDAEDRTSGTWKLKDGEVIMTATASTMSGTVGQVHSYRITSITDSEVLYIDNQTGQRRIEWKLR
jgi:uncharacterized protein (TIGR03067 family)